MLSRHVFSYLTAIFKEIDIRKNGKPDHNGVATSPRTVLLLKIELVLGCILTGLVIRHMSIMSN